jgi:predicted LPLAT superfamily acyltransferase
VQVLLDKGAEVNAKTNKGATALMVAAERGSDQIIRALLDKGAEVNAQDNDGFTALISASSMGHLEAVQVLLDKGANVNAETKKGTTALMMASSTDQPDVVQALLDNGAKVNAKTSHGLTALMRAAEGGKITAVWMLLRKGAEINAQDYEGKTALMKSCMGGHVKVVQALIESGVDLSARNNQGMTALMQVKDTLLSKPKATEDMLMQGVLTQTTLKARQAALNADEASASVAHRTKVMDEASTTKSTKKAGQRTFNPGGFFTWLAIMVFIGIGVQNLSLKARISGEQGDPVALILLIIGIPVSFFLLSFRKREF